MYNCIICFTLYHNWLCITINIHVHESNISIRFMSRRNIMSWYCLLIKCYLSSFVRILLSSISWCLSFFFFYIMTLFLALLLINEMKYTNSHGNFTYYYLIFWKYNNTKNKCIFLLKIFFSWQYKVLFQSCSACFSLITFLTGLTWNWKQVTQR